MSRVLLELTELLHSPLQNDKSPVYSYSSFVKVEHLCYTFNTDSTTSKHDIWLTLSASPMESIFVGETSRFNRQFVSILLLEELCGHWGKAVLPYQTSAHFLPFSLTLPMLK